MRRMNETSNVITEKQPRELMREKEVKLEKLIHRKNEISSFLEQNLSSSSIASGNSVVDQEKISASQQELDEIERRIEELTRTGQYVEHHSDEESSLEGNSPKLNKKLAKALLILGLLLAVSSAAVLVALYMPNNMPTVINDIVTNLSPFYHDLILGCAYGAGALGLLGALYKGTEVYKGKPLSLVSNSADLEQQPNPVVAQNEGLSSFKESTKNGDTRFTTNFFKLVDTKRSQSVQEQRPKSSLSMTYSNSAEN